MQTPLNPEQVLQDLRHDFELAKTLHYDEIFSILEKYCNNAVLLQFIADKANALVYETSQEMKGLLFGMLRIGHVEANRYLDAENLPRHLKMTTFIKNALKGQFRLNAAVPIFDQQVVSERIIMIQQAEFALGRAIPKLTPDGGVIYPLGEAQQDNVVSYLREGRSTLANAVVTNTIDKTVDLKAGYEELLDSPGKDHTTDLMEYLGIVSALAVLLMREAQITGSVDTFSKALATWNEYYDVLLEPELDQALAKNVNTDRSISLSNEALLASVVYPKADLSGRLQLFREARALKHRTKAMNAAANSKWSNDVF